MATIGNSSDEYFTLENQNISTYGFRIMPKVDNTGNPEKDYILLFPETISENVIYVNKDKNMRTVAQALNYILSSNFDKPIDEHSPAFTEPKSLIELFEGDNISTIVGKLAKAITELKALLQFVNESDISSIGDGTITGAISFLNEQFTDNYGAIEEALDTANRTVI